MRQNIITAIFILSLLAGGYYWYVSVSGSDEVAAPAAEEERQFISSNFLATLAVLEGIEIDSEFFRNSLFQELRGGIKLPPPPQERGRSNPFR